MKKSLKQKLALILAIIMLFTMSLPLGIIAGAAEGDDEGAVDPPVVDANAIPSLGEGDVTATVLLTSVQGSIAGMAGEEVGNLFNMTKNTKYCGNWENPPLKISWAMNSAVAVQTLAITSGGDSATYSDRDPKDFTLYGSNDGAEWVALHSRSGQGFAANGLTKIYAFENETAYAMYKLEITENNGAAMFQICAIQLSTESLADQDADLAAKDAAEEFDTVLAAFDYTSYETNEELEAVLADLRAQYNALDATAKGMLKNAGVLSEAEAYIAKKGIPAYFEALVAKIDAAITAEEGKDDAATEAGEVYEWDYHIQGDVTDALALYADMNDDDKAGCADDVEKLEGYRATLDEKIAALDITIGTFDYSLATKNPWLLTFTDDEVDATKAAVAAELGYQHIRLGYKLGGYDGNIVNVTSEWGAMLMSQQEVNGDGVTNPWYAEQIDRMWSAVMVPFKGTAFSATGYFGATDNGFTVLSDEFIYNGRVYQQRWGNLMSYEYGYNAPVVEGGSVVAPALRVEANVYPGSNGSADITKNTFRYAYALYNTAKKVTETDADDIVIGISYTANNLGIPAANAVATGDVVYQQFAGPEGIAYIVAAKADIDATDADDPGKVAYVLNGDILETVLAQGDTFEAAIAKTGAPIAAVDAEGNQLFENGIVSAEGFEEYTEENKYLVVANKISKLPTVVNKANYEAVGASIKAIEADYDALSDAGRENVDRTALDELKTTYTTFVADVEKALAVEALIADIPATVTAADEAAIKKADDAYNALTPEQRALVENSAVLTAAKNALTAAIQGALYTEVLEMIEALPAHEELTSDKIADYKDDITAAYNKFFDLDLSYQEMISDEHYYALMEKWEILAAGGYENWASTQVVKGDLTGEGKVTVSDILALKNIIMSGKAPTADQLAAADTNNDSKLTVADILGVKAIIMG